jgi:hypothetical protein
VIDKDANNWKKGNEEFGEQGINDLMMHETK